MADSKDTAPARAGVLRRLFRASLHHKAASTAGFLAAVVSITGGIFAMTRNTGGSHESAAVHVRDCIAQHGLSRARDVLVRGGAHVYVTCVWPAPPWSDQDGYAELVVRTVPGPGQFEASGTTEADRIASPCREIEAAYSFGAQGDFDRRAPLDLVRGSIVTDDGEIWREDPRTLPFYPERDETIVLHNSRSRLDYVRCISAA